MVDEELPTTQFHSYQKPDATPHSERATPGRLQGALQKAGISSKGGKLDFRAGVDKFRTYANANPGKVLGGLAALVIGAGLMSKRSHRR